MEFKKCNGCLEVKPVSEFGKESRAKNGYKPRCKKCYNADYKHLYPNFKSKKAETSKIRYAVNKEEKKQYAKNYYYANRDAKLAYRKKYASENKDKIYKDQKKYHERNKLTNLFYRTSRSYRKLLYRLKFNKTGLKTADILGYSYNDLISKLGREPNKDEDIDHKIPVSWFIDVAEVKLINHLDNLQILTSDDNNKKLNSFSHPICKHYYDIIIHKIKPKYSSKITYYGN